MGEAAEVLNTAFFKNLKLKLLAIPSLRLITKYIKQYNNISEKNLKKFLHINKEKIKLFFCKSLHQVKN